MRARKLLLAGTGLTLLASGCVAPPYPYGSSSSSSDAPSRPRQRFEVTPAGVRNLDGDREVAEAPRRPRTARPPVDPDDARSAAPSEATAGSDPDVDSVRQQVEAHRQAVAAARAPRGPAATRPPQEAATDEGPPADRVNADPQPAAPRQRPGRTRQTPAPPPAPAPEQFDPPEEPSAANQATQVAPPAPAPPPPLVTPIPAAPVPAGAVPAGGRLSASPLNGVTASVSTDPDPLATRLGDRVRATPGDLAAHLDAQMLHFLRDEPVPQMDAITTLSAEDREVLTALMDGLSNFRNGLRADKNMLLSQKVKPILDLSDRIRSQAELTIPTIAVCSRVQGFGVYDPMPNSLKAGVDNALIIYCEVQNFSSQQNDKALWETKLSQEAVLYTETGLAVWRDKSDIPVDLSRNRRHDFFVVKKVTLPKALGVGRYVLKVTIVDEQVKRVAENSVTLQALAQ